jgi:hypothetical protein
MSRKCLKKVGDVRCSQPATPPAGRCRQHQRWRAQGIIPDGYYERKLALGLVKPAEEIFTQKQLEAMMYGRQRGDGRPIDQYISALPLGWRPEEGEQQ